MCAVDKKFSAALKNQQEQNKIPVIPDIKCRSPKEGDLLKGRDPIAIAEQLTNAGAAVLSVVTEPLHFGGSLELLQRLALKTSLPILRKDFITREEQLKESKDMGASAVLLIASIMEPPKLQMLFEAALALGLEPLVEAHNESEIKLANELGVTIVGINNRNILDLERDNGDVTITESLVKIVRPGVFIVSESSIQSPEDAQRAIAAGAHAVLVGTAILQAPDPVRMYRVLTQFPG
ncbi:indole-3-glycerol-phosphate synthase [Zhaonella formicivorans]|jgi:indole-3-glycerol phosphate synthase|uniref:indole-3-glycerol-phosphate synthase n=1 Tax=Zhaonella formicivorans TaxID=2528593 RepID=UPI001D12D77F|nr:indole-3-glycerol-phosphate synthase [Zhaonella formicivorans]